MLDDLTYQNGIVETIKQTAQNDRLSIPIIAGNAEKNNY